jgi:hypothetical protein
MAGKMFHRGPNRQIAVPPGVILPSGTSPAGDIRSVFFHRRHETKVSSRSGATTQTSNARVSGVAAKRGGVPNFRSHHKDDFGGRQC